jgi:3-phenylpropionate/trans-cinnamate dioxygenase ferredoxin subunit
MSGIWHRAGAVSDFPEGTVVSVEIDRQNIVVCNTGEALYALVDECSHESIPFGHARLFKHELICPRHGARFDCRTGKVLSAPAIVPIETYQVKVDGSDVFVLLEG